MEYVFIEAIAGISKKSDKPYHMIKLADPETFENHVVSYDPNYLQKPDFPRGSRVEINGDLRTPFGNTQFVVTDIRAAG